MQQLLRFGTDGVRGPAHLFPFTRQALYSLGRALGLWYQQHNQENNTQLLPILIGCDTRESCERIKKDLVDGLLTYNFCVVDAGVVPTPAIQSVLHGRSDYGIGIMISASHNLYHDNGIKIFTAGAGKLTRKQEETIEELFATEYTQPWHDYPIIGSSMVDGTIISHYGNNICTYFSDNFLQGVHVVVDCAFGAMAPVAPGILEQFGARVTALHVAYTGYNINERCGAVHPDALRNVVIEQQADVGIGFDGDGDRIVVVAKNGTIYDGDDIIALLLQLPQYQRATTVVGTIMSNLGLELYLHKKNIQFLRVPVGDKYVAAGMEADSVLLGGEPSGHIIAADYLPSGDGLFIGLRVLEAMVRASNFCLPTFTKYAQTIINMPVTSKKDLTIPQVATIIDHYRAAFVAGRLLVRYSGTENVLRVMTEGHDRAMTQSIAEQLVVSLKDVLCD